MRIYLATIYGRCKNFTWGGKIIVLAKSKKQAEKFLREWKSKFNEEQQEKVNKDIYEGVADVLFEGVTAKKEKELRKKRKRGFENYKKRIKERAEEVEKIEWRIEEIRTAEPGIIWKEDASRSSCMPT